MGITSLIRKRAVFLKTGDATKYLNIRSLDISGEALNYSGDKVRDLARSEKLKYNKTKENGNFLFKTSWLEQYLKELYGSSYASPEVKKGRFSEYDINQNVQNGSSIPDNAQGFLSSTASQAPSQQVLTAEDSGDLLTRIKKSPPLIYLSALVIGFTAGSGYDVGDKLIETGYFSDRVKVENPISEPAANKIVYAIGKERPDSEFGKRIRELNYKNLGPFQNIKKRLTIHLFDPTDTIFEPGYNKYVVDSHAVVCSSSDIWKSTIHIKMGDDKLGSFKAIYQHVGACDFGDSDRNGERIVVSRQSFEEKLKMDTTDQEFIDVDAIIDNS